LYDLTQKIYSLVGISHKGNTVLRKDATWLEEVTEYNYSKWLKQMHM
jgi:hypothetical protein